MEKLTIIEPNKMAYNGEQIKFNTNKGEFIISYEDAFEIVWTFLDAVGELTKVEALMEKIDKDYNMGKF